MNLTERFNKQDKVEISDLNRSMELFKIILFVLVELKTILKDDMWSDRDQFE